jgi:hypothetical protein
MADELLCRSGWITDSRFACTSGWGSIRMDTTWFRIKARETLNGTPWESGWSSASYFTAAGGSIPDPDRPAYADLPDRFDIRQNYPNPFNDETIISYQLSEPGFVEVRIYNVRGALVRNLVEENQQAGYRTIVWRGDDDRGMGAASGIYLGHVVIRTDDGKVFQKRFKMMMLK